MLIAEHTTEAAQMQPTNTGDTVALRCHHHNTHHHPHMQMENTFQHKHHTARWITGLVPTQPRQSFVRLLACLPTKGRGR
mgnify:CR=1 FL=1